MSRIIRFGTAILFAACVGCASENSTGGLTTGIASGGLTTAGLTTGGLTTGASPPSCEPPCGQHSSCILGSAGASACQCDDSYTLCPVAAGATVCAQLETDPSNCGACGSQCPQGEQCTLGICTCPVSPNIAPCETEDGGLLCVDLTSDDNCGGCGNLCEPNQACTAEGGGAACVCLDGGPGVGLENCGGVCTNTNQDPFNCGSCGVVCVSGSCVIGDAGTGVCNCPAPYNLCGQDCVDLSKDDPYHCGSCDMVCLIQGSLETACVDGHCICGVTGQGVLCPDGACAMLRSDPQDCGQCGNVCVAPAPNCVDGGCTAG